MLTHYRPVTQVPNSVFDNFFQHLNGEVESTAPPVDLWEDEDALHVKVELPGYALEDIEVMTRADQLVIRAKRDVETCNGKSHLREIRSGSFERRLSLPFEVDSEHVAAKLDKGVLHVEMPRSENDKPRRIEIKSSR